MRTALTIEDMVRIKSRQDQLESVVLARNVAGEQRGLTCLRQVTNENRTVEGLLPNFTDDDTRVLEQHKVEQAKFESTQTK